MQNCIWYSPPSFLLDGETPSFLTVFGQKTQISRFKKTTVGFFEQGLSQ